MRAITAWFGVLASLVCASQVAANTISFSAGMVFSGTTAPAGSTPWLNATFDDGGAAGTVTLTLSATNLTGGEFVGDWYFNLDPALDSSSLLFSAPTKVGSFGDPGIGKATDAYQADGDGKYDIEFAFAMGGAGVRFGAGESATYTITGISTLTANSFKFLSSPAGGHGPYYTAAHVQGIAIEGGTTSAWVTVPEPSSFVLAVAGILGLAFMGRRASKTRREG